MQVSLGGGMVDTRRLGRRAVRHGGSTPLLGTRRMSEAPTSVVKNKESL